MTHITMEIRRCLTLLLHEHDQSITTPINYCNLPCVTPATTQQMNSVDCGLYLLLFAQRLIDHYGEYNISTSLAHNQRKINGIFSFFQLPCDAVACLRSQILNVIDELCGETQGVSSDSDSSDIECVFMRCCAKKKQEILKQK